HTRFSRDWSSDVCSSDLRPEIQVFPPGTVIQGIQIGIPGEPAIARGLVPDILLAAEHKSQAGGVPCQIDTQQGRPRKIAWQKGRSEERRVGQEGRWQGRE